MENNVKQLIIDRIKIMERGLKAAEEQKVALEKYCADIAGIMEELKTDTVKQELAEMTQANYAKMVELEVNMAKMKKIIKSLKVGLLML